MRRLAVLGTIGLVLLLAEIAPAVAPAIRVDPNDLPVEIHATLGEPDTYSTDLRLTAVNATVEKLQLLGSDLAPAAGGDAIGRRHVKLEPTEPKLPKGEPVDVTIKVDGIERAGTYTGSIELFPKGEHDALVTLPIALLVSEQGPPKTFGTARITVDPEDTPLEIRATLGQEDSFVETIRLGSTGAEIKNFAFLPSRLRREDGGVTLGRQHVEMPAAHDIGRGRPSDHQVKVTGVTRAGVYRGQFTLLCDGCPDDRAVVVPLTLIAHAAPTLDPVKGSEQLQLRLAQCGRWDCWAVRFLAPNAASRERTLKFQVPALSDVSITGVQLVARGEKGGHDLVSSELGAAVGPQEGGLATVKVVTAHEPPADKYTGSLFFAVSGRDDRFVIPVDVAVKDGPLGAVLAIFGALLFSRLLRWATGRGGPLGEAQQTLDALRARIDREVPNDRALLQPVMIDVERAVERGDVDRAAALSLAISARIELLTRIARLKASNLTDDGDVVLLEKARREVGLGHDAEAKSIVEGVDGRLTNRQPDEDVAAAVNQAWMSVLGDMARARDAAESAASAGSRVASSATDKGRGVLRGASFLVAGTSPWVLGTAHSWFTAGLRVLFGLALLILLTIVGLEALYANASDSFGSAKVYDYLALVVWGLSAEVAQRTLTNLRGSTT
jgi:hypothetical protein